jgi:tetratricopeptide (TPR) repeat protein
VSGERLARLFGEAAALETADREAFLAALHGEDRALAGELASLLAAGDGSAGLLDESPWQALGGEPLDGAPPLPGVVGSYHVVRPIGRGGMGRVFLAEQQGEGFRRRVALKVVDRPGAETIRRFRDEIRILAGLEHHGIARFYDAGRVADGNLFLALEYVEGEDLLSFVRHRRLDLRARIELFLQVLDAVDFAHRRLVVHRDLKPGNVLVDVDGRPKLLDFGISKILDAETRDGDGGTATRSELRAFTPAYASPEQLRGERATVATDVYSLGVVLYELLAGRRPFERRAANGGESAGDAIHRDPEPPSTAARHAGAQAAGAAAAAMALQPISWRVLAGDLDAVVLKALRVEPESRYRSAAAFADDLRRWLRGEQVEARRGGRRYRLAKLVRRHRLPLSLGALVVLALAGGLAGTLAQARRAGRAAALAEAERDFALRQLSRAEAINELNSFLLTDAAPGGKPFTVGDLLSRAERIVAAQQARPHGQHVEMMIAVGRELNNHDEIPKARALLAAAYEQARGSADATMRARAACALAFAVARSGEYERAEALVDEGLSALSAQPLHALSRIYCLQLGGEVAREGNQPERSLERTLAAQRQLRDSGQGSALLEVRLASDLAESYRLAGRDREANLAFADAAARLEAVGYGESETAGTLFNNWALALRSQGNPLAAERLFRRAVAIASAKEGLDSVTPITLNNLGYTLADLDRLEETRSMADRAYELARRQGDARAMVQALFLGARVRLRTGDVDSAARLMAEVEPMVEALPPGHPTRAAFASQMGMVAEGRGDVAAAIAAQGRAIAMVEGDPARAFHLGFFLLRRAEIAREAGQPALARDDAARALELVSREVEPGARSFWIGRTHLVLGQALRALGEHERARGELAAALQHLEPTLGADHADSRAARELAAAP